MLNSKTYVTLERVVKASSVGISALELLFNGNNAVFIGNDEDFEFVKVIEQLTYNNEYSKILDLINEYKNR